jgi:hypothetical protein
MPPFELFSNYDRDRAFSKPNSLHHRKITRRINVNPTLVKATFTEPSFPCAPVVETTARRTLTPIVVVHLARMSMMEGRAWDVDGKKIITRLWLPRVCAILSLAYGRSTPEIAVPHFKGFAWRGNIIVELPLSFYINPRVKEMDSETR